ncbi:hypothetical protein NDU88_003838 [Pleurodeles waltl]|uniref:Uncharacterized protein n=1 Tax=Pleurodeles waltl TaxID=8319 RepID=A0AAV7RF21_PLEWA|nr:hypothetical protein NDU88_003838 [Pleurodeles waltl]
MPNGKAAGKHTSQLLFSKAISLSHPMASPTAPAAPSSRASETDTHSDTAMEHILQETAAVGCRLEAMDSKITDPFKASHSIRSVISSFHDKVTNLDHRLTEVEGQLAVRLERDSELQFLCDKLTDLEDRNRRDNVSFFGIPECKVGTDIKAYLREFQSDLTGLAFSPALDFQRVHRISPIHKADSGKPCSIITCLLCHKQARQIITAARAHGPYNMEGNEI